MAGTAITAETKSIPTTIIAVMCSKTGATILIPEYQ